MTTAPQKKQTLAELRELQRKAGAVIMRPLTRNWQMQRRWTDDRDMRDVVAEFIKPNDRLTSFERIEIYNRQYWFRLVDCMFEDFPGLNAVLGHGRFTKLVLAYLKEHPSHCYTLRDLGKKLPDFIQKNPELVAPRFELASDMVNFEWAQVVAFDGPARTPVTVDDLLGRDPAKLRLSLQPYLTVLSLRYPLDEYLIQMKQDNLRGQASNAIDEGAGEAREKRRRKILPRRKTTCVVVHRHQNVLYYKRLDPPAHRLLTALQSGKSLSKALAAAFDADPDPELIKSWFTQWTSLGWFCKAR